MRLLPLALLATLGLSSLNGCATYGYGYGHGAYHHAYHGGGIGLAFAAGALIGAAAASAHDDPPPEPEVVTRVVYVNAPPPVLVTPPAPPPNLPPREHYDAPEASFDAAGARVALHDVDLRACKERGAPVGYGHAKITFAADGSVKNVLIDGPPGLAPDAVSCIGTKLGEAHVAPFRGADVSAPYVYRIE